MEPLTVHRTPTYIYGCLRYHTGLDLFSKLDYSKSNDGAEDGGVENLLAEGFPKTCVASGWDPLRLCRGAKQSRNGSGERATSRGSHGKGRLHAAVHKCTRRTTNMHAQAHLLERGEHDLRRSAIRMRIRVKLTFDSIGAITVSGRADGGECYLSEG